MQSDITQAVGFDGGERPGHAVDESLNADKAGLRAGLRLRRHRFAAAKADLERNFGHGHGKQLAKPDGGGARQIDSEARQQRLEQPRLTPPQFVSFAPAKERARLMKVGIHRPSCAGSTCASRFQKHNACLIGMAGTRPAMTKCHEYGDVALAYGAFYRRGEVGLFPGKAAVLVGRAAEMTIS